MADAILQMLMDMGFSKERAETAISATGNSGVEAAAEWLINHPEGEGSGGHRLGSSDSSNSQQQQQQQEGGSRVTDSDPPPNGNDDAPVQAKSIKCDECGKLFKSELDAQAHAARTQHANFSESVDEIKPLTEEEKKAQLARLEEKIKHKRAEREEREKLDAKEREKVRRKTGQEISQIKHDLEMKEARKIAEMKKREKLEEKRAREKVREEIARDKAEKAAREQNKKQPQQPTTAASPIAPAATKNYDTCKLQIRLFGGKTLVNTFNATDTLVEVNRYILMNRTDDGSPYSLMTPFPKHVFTGEDSNKSLKELGLVPSAVLTLTRHP